MKQLDNDIISCSIDINVISFIDNARITIPLKYNNTYNNIGFDFGIYSKTFSYIAFNDKLAKTIKCDSYHYIDKNYIKENTTPILFHNFSTNCTIIGPKKIIFDLKFKI